MPRPVLSPGYFRAVEAEQEENLARALSHSVEWDFATKEELPSSPDLGAPTTRESHAPSPSPSPPPVVTERLLNPSSDEALVIKLQGLTRSLSPLARMLVIDLGTPVLRKTVRFSEEEALSRERILGHERVLTVKAWGVHGLEGSCSVTLSGREEILRRPAQDPSATSLATRVQAMAAELGLSVPCRENDAALVPGEGENANEQDQEPSDDDDQVEREGPVTSFSPDTITAASAAFHTHTLPLALPFGRRSPPLPTPSTSTSLAQPTPRAGRTLQGLGPGWAEASRQSQVA